MNYAVCILPLNSIARAWCMPTANMLPASIYNCYSIITQYSTVMLFTSNNNIMISLLPLPCCLLYILSNTRTIFSANCIQCLSRCPNKFTFSILRMLCNNIWHPLLTWYHEHIRICKFILDNELSTPILLPLDFLTLPTLLSQKLAYL